MKGKQMVYNSVILSAVICLSAAAQAKSYSEHIRGEQYKKKFQPFQDSVDAYDYGKKKYTGFYPKKKFHKNNANLNEVAEHYDDCQYAGNWNLCYDHHDQKVGASQNIKKAPVQNAQAANGQQYVQVDGTQYPVCASSAADPDGDTWGWENNTTCKLVYFYCSDASSDADGDGWGWENDRSCVVR